LPVRVRTLDDMVSVKIFSEVSCTCDMTFLDNLLDLHLALATAIALCLDACRSKRLCERLCVKPSRSDAAEAVCGPSRRIEEGCLIGACLMSPGCRCRARAFDPVR
jgi:hypothetical protein